MKCKVLSLIIGIFTLGSVMASAQTVSANLNFENGFSAIEASDYFAVTLKNADYYGADYTVDAAIKNYVHVYVRGSVLEVSVDRKSFDSETKKLYSGNKAKNAVIKVTVYAPEVSSIKATDNAVVDASGYVNKVSRFTIDATDDAVVKGFSVDASASTISAAKKAAVSGIVLEGGNVSFNTQNSAVVSAQHDSKKLSLQTNGTSDLTVTGKCETIEVTANNSSKLTIKGSTVDMQLNASSKEIHAEELKVNDVIVVGSNGCKVYINPSDNLSLDLKGGCLVSYGGKPGIEIVNIQNSSVSHLNL